jgi:hypothetical protein
MNRITKKERILVERTKISKIMSALGCGQAAVYNALSFRTNSKLAGDIRDMAVNRFGGVKVKENILIR